MQVQFYAPGAFYDSADPRLTRCDPRHTECISFFLFLFLFSLWFFFFSLKIYGDPRDR